MLFDYKSSILYKDWIWGANCDVDAEHSELYVLFIQWNDADVKNTRKNLFPNTLLIPSVDNHKRRVERKHKLFEHDE